jgi:hypothetical protein
LSSSVRFGGEGKSDDRRELIIGTHRSEMIISVTDVGDLLVQLWLFDPTPREEESVIMPINFSSSGITSRIISMRQ